MKLPLYQPTHTAVPARSAQPSSAVADPTGAGLAQLGAAGMAAAAQWGNIAAQEARDQAAEDARAERLRAAAEKAKQAHLDDIDATTDLNATRDELDVIRRDMTRGERDPDTDEVLVPPVGPREFMTEYEKRATVARNRLLSKERTPGAQQRVQKEALRIFGDRTHDARTYSDTLAVQVYDAQFEQSVENLERRIGRERDPERRAALEAELAGVFQRAQGMKTLPVLQARARKSEENIDTAVALMDAETDPLGTIEKLRPPLEKGGPPSPYRLGTKEAEALAVTIGNRYDRQVTEQETRRKAAQAVIDKEQTEAYHAETSDLYASAKSKTTTADEIEEWRRKYRGRAQVDQDYLKLTAILAEPKKPVKEWKSDPKVAGAVAADVLSINPTYTPADLIRLNESELLDENDLKYALNALRQNAEHKRSLGETAAGRARDQANRDHSQAEQELRVRIMGPDSFFKQFDEKKERIYGQALTQLRARSSAYGGKEAPLEVVDAMLPNILKSVGSQTLMRAEEARAGLTFPNETALVAARKAGRITEPYYREQWQRFRVIEQAEKDLRDNAAGGNDDAAKALEKLRGGKAAPAPAVPEIRTTPRSDTGTGRLRDLSERQKR